ncbi:CpsD/CapB family tyrosine-protein kinase [Enterococcus sp. AZ109]|uniref:CpsD/CapB family tyrosine-protein kinase n=1 Tax=Enterococcus sp. AZ109 TaxID=2774634 RepID=UPI003F23DA56
MAKKKSEILPVALIAATDNFSTTTEQYRTIRTNINFSSADKDIQTLVITSSGPSEGKSTTSANLAVVFAKAGSKVLLVDADLRKPSLAISFRLPNATGLSNLLTNREASIDNYYQTSDVENLYVMTSGPKPPNPSELLDSQRMVDLMNTMRESFDVVIFDMPPVVTVTDAQIVAAHTDGTLLVVRERKTKKQDIVKAKELLTRANANILGVVYNGKKKGDSAGYYYYG